MNYLKITVSEDRSLRGANPLFLFLPPLSEVSLRDHADISRQAKQSGWGIPHSTKPRLPRRPDVIGTPRNDRRGNVAKPDK